MHHILIVLTFFFLGLNPAQAALNKKDLQELQSKRKSIIEKKKTLSNISREDRIQKLKDYKASLESFSDNSAGQADSGPEKQLVLESALELSMFEAVQIEDFDFSKCPTAHQKMLSAFSPHRKAITELPKSTRWIFDEVDSICKDIKIDIQPKDPVF